MPTINKILVPVDYSECSRAALTFAAELARKEDAELDIVHVWDRPTYVSEAVMVRQSAGPSRSLIEMIRENAERDMDEFVAQAKLPAGLRFQRRLLSGNPAMKILAELERKEHDLVVIGDESGLDRSDQLPFTGIVHSPIANSPALRLPRRRKHRQDSHDGAHP